MASGLHPGLLKDAYSISLAAGLVPAARTRVNAITSEDLIVLCDYWGIQERDRV